MKARVTVTLKREVLDPQGEAIRKGFDALGVEGVTGVRVGKVIDVELAEGTADPQAVLRAAADKLLANPVIEEYAVELLPDAGAARSG